jgi:hypothetical protein
MTIKDGKKGGMLVVQGQLRYVSIFLRNAASTGEKRKYKFLFLRFEHRLSQRSAENSFATQQVRAGMQRRRPTIETLHPCIAARPKAK